MEELSGLLQALVLIAFVGGLALLAHWGKKNRGAEISLIVTVLFLSFLVLVLGVLTGLVGLSGAVPADQLPPALSFGSAAALVLAGVIGFVLCVPPLRHVLSQSRRRPSPGEPKPPGNPRGFWSEPPIFFGAWMFVVVLATNVVQILAFTLVPEVVDEAFASAGRVSVLALLSSQLPFFAVGVLGVGLGIRRGFREAFARLGYGPISVRQLGLVVLFVAGAVGLSLAADALFRLLQPGLYDRVGTISEGLLGTEGLSPLGAIAFGLLIGVGAAFGEETLFRGAIQPVFGITATSILFASMHVQYGPSVVLTYIFVLSVGLGLLRRYVNTTATFLAHAGYNFTLVLLSFLASGS